MLFLPSIEEMIDSAVGGRLYAASIVTLFGLIYFHDKAETYGDPCSYPRRWGPIWPWWLPPVIEIGGIRLCAPRQTKLPIFNWKSLLIVLRHEPMLILPLSAAWVFWFQQRPMWYVWASVVVAVLWRIMYDRLTLMPWENRWLGFKLSVVKLIWCAASLTFWIQSVVILFYVAMTFLALAGGARSSRKERNTS
jgi:hypothetical protein